MAIPTKWKSEGSEGSVVPDYIGYPAHQLTTKISKDGAPSDLIEQQIKDKLVYAVIKPKLPEISRDANVYEPRDAWGEFVKGLGPVQPPPKEQVLKVVLSNFTPVTEQYSNDFGESEILKSGNMLGSKLQEALQLTGAKDINELKQIIDKSKDGFLKTSLQKVMDVYQKGVNGVKNAALDLQEAGHDLAGGVAGAVAGVMSSPWSKIGWPQMWRNCAYQATYELNTRLYCFNTDDDATYRSEIQAALKALQLFVQPRSTDGILYTQPLMMDFFIPGMIHLPMAFCSHMSVVKGGDTGDFSQNGRPNIVDIRMTIQNVFSVSVNVEKQDKKYWFRPTVGREQQVLGGGKDLHRPTSYRNAQSSAPEENYDSVPPAIPPPTQNDAPSQRQTSEAAQEAAQGLYAGMGDSGTAVA